MGKNFKTAVFGRTELLAVALLLGLLFLMVYHVVWWRFFERSGEMMQEKQPKIRGYHFSWRWQELVIWGVAAADKIVHLSFDNNRHLEVCRSLSCRPLNTTQHLIVETFLLDILQGKAAAFPAHSPFIRCGTAFQQQVWRLLSHIPYGATRTYGDIAKDLGNAGLARAVGRACNRNPLPLIIPCHRVVSSSGLGGFAGGAQLKRWLLAFEQENVRPS